jgi:hypothetical protein
MDNIVIARLINCVEENGYSKALGLLPVRLFDWNKHCSLLITINHQQMYLRTLKKFNIFLETLLHVSAPRCHPQGAIRPWLKLIIT